MNVKRKTVAPESALLEVRELYAGYGATPVLNGVSLDVATGCVATVLGANGSGKTTLLRAICAMVATRGQVRLGGHRIEGLATEEIARLGVAHVPEGRGTFLRLSVEENLVLGACTRGDRAGVASDLARILEYFPTLRQRLPQQAGTLSGGEQQMLAVARGLMLRPRLLLLDEPSFGLAPLVVEKIFGIFRSVVEREQVAILLVEQNAALALALADWAYVLETGRVVASGAAAELAGDEAVRRAYLGT